MLIYFVNSRLFQFLRIFCEKARRIEITIIGLSFFKILRIFCEKALHF